MLDDISSQSVDEDNIFTYTLSADDVDGDLLTYSASVDGNASVSINGSTLTLIPSENYNGNILVSISVSDGQLSISTSFNIVVSPVDDSPITSEINVFVDEDFGVCLLYTSPSPRD